MTTDFINFFKNASAGTKINIGTSQSRGGIDSIAGASDRISEKVIQSETFQNAAKTFGNILRGNELPNTFRQQTFADNQIKLGEDLNVLGQKQIAIGETQTFFGESIGKLNQSLNNLNERVSGQLVNLGKSVSDASQAANDSSNVNSIFEKIGGALGFGAIGGALAVGAAILIISRR